MTSLPPAVPNFCGMQFICNRVYIAGDRLACPDNRRNGAVFFFFFLDEVRFFFGTGKPVPYYLYRSKKF